MRFSSFGQFAAAAFMCATLAVGQLATAAATGWQVISATFVQSNIVAIEFPRVGEDPAAVQRVATHCDAHTGSGESLVSERGVRVFVANKDDSHWPPRFEAGAVIYLKLKQLQAQGAPLHVECAPLGWSHVLHFNPEQPSPALAVSQFGFLPDAAPKRAWYTLWAGTLGGQAHSEPPAFDVVDAATGEKVWAGSAERADSGGTYTNPTWILDFSPVTTPGRYVVQVQGVGRSAAFSIGSPAASEVLRLAQRAFYHHRCGEALHAKYTDRPRPACHTVGGCFHAEIVHTPLYAGEAVGTCREEVVGGWHDASDYGRYVAPLSVALFYGLFAYERFPAQFPDGAAGIPESGNGTSDWLDELAVALDWLALMQGSGGGVYHKLTSRKYGTHAMPHLDDQRLDFAEMTTHATARTAAVMARAARVFGPVDPARAARYRAVAERAWTFLRAHPGAVPDPGFRNREWNGGGDYADRFGDVDERAWAAAEWMMLVEQSDPELEALIRGPIPSPLNGLVAPMRVHDWPPPFEDAWRFALLTYMEPSHPGTDQELRDAIKKGWAFRGDDLAKQSASDAYGLSFRPKVGGGFGFGHMNGVRWALDLLLAEWVAGASPRWRQAAWANAGVLFGANPRATSYVTGVGERAVHVIEYRINHLDGSKAPLPGHPVDGPASGLHGSARAAEALFLPRLEDTPPPFRYADIHDPVLNEPTVLEMAEMVYMLAALAGPKPRQSGE